MSLFEQFLLGIYLGVITGILPGVVAWSLGFIFKYFTKVSVPALGVMVLAVALAGVQGGLLGLLDVQGVTSIVALLVVMMVSMYCHSLGDGMGASFPHRVSLRSLKNRTLSSDVIEGVGRFGQVRINVVGDVVEMEGYAPLPEETKNLIKNGEWTFPADLSVSELENRLAERLTSEFDLADVSVSVDERGKATVVAAPPMSGLSKRVPRSKRAVSFDVLVPTGVSVGDEVEVELTKSSVTGTVVSARSGTSEKETQNEETSEDEKEPGEMTVKKAPTTTGGEGRITVAVDKKDANRILESEPNRVYVRSRGNRREYELISVLRSSGRQFSKVEVGGSVGEYATIGSIDVRGNYGVIVLAVRHAGSRTLAPRGEVAVRPGDSLFVVGQRSDIDSFREALG